MLLQEIVTEATNYKEYFFEALAAVLTIYSGYLTYRYQKTKNRTDETIQLIDRLNEELNRLSEREEAAREENKLLTEKIHNLEKREIENHHRILLLETAHHNKPFPEWLKDMDGTMLSLNNEYERLFLKPQGLTMYDYVGKTDEEVWPEEVALRFKQNDHAAVNSPNGYITKIEEIKSNDQVIDTKGWVIKYVRKSGDVPIGIGGIWIPQSLINYT